ncbi:MULTISPECIES: DNA-deoxyinosine glycosylase [Sphingobacterium]|uniref:DNA-deoxyinosine glycosylase n=1 Tax=Sphingobacterium litopenaei TaxID=2763500 RepID=A0ABR7YGP3_9SPHI|nr:MULTISPECIES: DNA-deoxyinosine glycosylase [Sphingobacterium]MBD1430488.1 DNA-deoxyinosine glycosylase [Sphingobacterium litopenaei]NGM73532.1 DNA-deoxyinosine glycosylase [Sphingobacterium sp. SGL-16]
MLKQSFAPIIPNQPRILILGSLPGDLSIAKDQYYAHPQNRFWKVLFALFEQEFTSDYSERIKLLHQQQIALWDVCASAIRPGSMDTDISEVIPNTIPQLLAEKPAISNVIFNGQKAQKLFEKYFKKQENLNYITLPSTSPANAQFSIEKLLQHWEIIKI